MTPDPRSTAVFKRGTENGLIGHTLVGGHIDPSSMVGESLLWKNAQKNAEKNITSEEINKIIPHSILFWTGFVWSPKKVLSRDTSRHQHIIVLRVIAVERDKINVMFM